MANFLYDCSLGRFSSNLPENKLMELLDLPYTELEASQQQLIEWSRVTTYHARQQRRNQSVPVDQ